MVGGSRSHENKANQVGFLLHHYGQKMGSPERMEFSYVKHKANLQRLLCQTSAGDFIEAQRFVEKNTKEQNRKE